MKTKREKTLEKVIYMMRDHIQEGDRLREKQEVILRIFPIITFFFGVFLGVLIK